MMKSRGNRSEQASSSRTKSESTSNGTGSSAQRNQAQLMNNQQANVQTMRKRRSSINVYDQPSSLNSRLRQLETDMLRLDEDRTKLFDDTHSALAQYEIKLAEIHAILKSRQDNVEKYVEDMKVLLAAKEEFEKQTKLLNDKHERIHEKFMHRETTISREIKLLKNKFELLEKNRQFKSILQKSNSSNTATSDINEDLASGLDPTNTSRSEGNSVADSLMTDKQNKGQKSGKSVRIKLPKLARPISQLFSPLINLKKSSDKFLRRSNRVASIPTAVAVSLKEQEGQASDVKRDDEVVKPTADGLQDDNDLAKEVHDSTSLKADEKMIGSEVAEVATTESPSPSATTAAQSTTATSEPKVASVITKPSFFKRLFKKK